MTYEWMTPAEQEILARLERHVARLGEMAAQKQDFPSTAETLPVFREILADIRTAGIWTVA